MMALLLALTLAGSLAVPLTGQTLPITVPPDTPLIVTWTHDGLGMPSFRWWCDGAIVKNFSFEETNPARPANTDGSYTYTVEVPGLTAGTHLCFISAYNDVSEAKADPVPIVAAVPKAPSKPYGIGVAVKPGGGLP